MKKIIYTLTLVFIVFYSFSQCPADSSLYLDLRFSGNDADSSVYWHPILSLGGPSLASDRNNNANSAYLFDGDDDHSVVADSNANYKCTFPITISVWINPDTISLTNPIFTNEDYQGAYTGVWLQVTSDGYLACSYGDGTGNSGSSRMSAIGTTLVPTHQWSHVVAVIHNLGSFSLYLNGVAEPFNLNGSGAGLVYIDNDSMPSRVASFFKGNSTPRFFKGVIDDLRFWHAELGENEAIALYTGNPVAQSIFKYDTIALCEGLLDTLYAPSSYCNKWWSTGETTASIIVNGGSLGEGNHPIVFYYEDDRGFIFFDTIVMHVQTCTTGIEDQLSTDLKVYPNPITDHLMVELMKGTGTETSVELYSVTGQLLHQQTLVQLSSAIYTNKLTPGIYILQVKSGQSIYRKRMIKE